jgi:hypothetical protein
VSALERLGRRSRRGGSLVETGWRRAQAVGELDTLAPAEPGSALDARSRLAWFGLDAYAAPLLAEPREDD